MLPNALLQSSSAAAPSKLGNLYDLILAGGPVMVPIGLCSVVALAFFVERWGALAKGRLAPGSFAPELATALSQSPAAARDFCEKQPKVAIARVMASGLRRAHEGRDGVERAVEESGSREVTAMMQRLRPLQIITALAPLLGLLGTVTGMITAFQVMAVQKGIGKPELLAGGIAEALVTTAAGLFVAIPVQVVYYWFRAKVDRFASAVEVTFDDVVARSIDAGAAAAAVAQPKAA